MSFQPSEAELMQVINVIKNGFNHTDRAAIEGSVKFMQENSGDPKFNGCLAIIASTPGCAETSIRVQCGLALKNNIVRNFASAIRPNIDLIKQKLQNSLEHTSEEDLRRALAQCIAEVAKEKAWPSLIPEMWPKFCASNDPGFRKGVLTVVKVICEDSAENFEEEIPGNPGSCQADILVPELIKVVTESQAPEEVLLAITSCFNLLNDNELMEDNQIHKKFGECLGSLLAALKRCTGMAQGPCGKDILRHTLYSYRMTLYYYGKLKESQQLSGVLQLVYQCTEVADLEISLAACEFWNDLTDNTHAVLDLVNTGLLPNVCSLLMNKLDYSEEEFQMIMEEESADQVKPKSSSRKRQEEGEEDDDTVEQWTVRKCAAATLDELSKKERERLISPPGKEQGWFIKEEILTRLSPAQHWKKQESAMLALGAISKSCSQTEIESLLDPMLGLVQDESCHFLVRSMTFWAIGRFVTLISASEGRFDTCMRALLACMAGGKRKVQESAVSTFASLLENEVKGESYGYLKKPEYLHMILERIEICIAPGSYTHRNFLILIDAIQSFVEAFPDECVTERGDKSILRPLVTYHYQNLSETDDVFFTPLSLAVFNMIRTLSRRFPQQYLEIVFMKSLRIIGQYFQFQTQLLQNPEADLPDIVNATVVSVEMVKMIVAEQDSPEAALSMCKIKLPGTDFTLIDLVLMPLTHPQLDTKDYIIMVCENFIGDSLSLFPPEELLMKVVNSVPNLLSLMMEDGYVRDDSLSNDTSWLCGEIIFALHEKFPKDMIKPVLTQMLNALMPVLVSEEGVYEINLLQNFALAIGKFGLVDAELMAPQLAQYCEPLLTLIADIPEYQDSTEKIRGMLGAASIISLNFEVMGREANVIALGKFMMRCGQLNECEQLQHAFHSLLTKLKAAYGPKWEMVKQNVPFPPVILARLE